MFRNPELKRAGLKLLLAQALFALLVFGFTSYEIKGLNKTIVQQNTTLVGQLLAKHPELEGELIHLVTKKASPEEVKAGQLALSKYGYGEDMELISQPVLRDFYADFQWKSTSMVVLFAIPLMLLLFAEYKGFFGRVREIATAAERVIEGDYSVKLPEDREGDFSLLGHNFNLMAARLKLGMDRLTQDKLFLKNIIADISHQLKTPLSSLLTLNELLLKEKTAEPGLRASFLEKSRSQLERMEWLITSLLKLARLEAGAIEFKHSLTPLMDPVGQAVQTLRLRGEEKGLTINISGDESAFFSGDLEWTAEALINIIKNCIEHTPEGGEIGVSVSETPLYSRINVTDNGEGIDKGDLPHIFERFYKGSNSVKAESVGIGLALTKLIIEGQGGFISATSEKGKGSKFVITFLKGTL